MKSTYLRLLGLVLIVVGAGLLGLYSRKNVTLITDGRPLRMATLSGTVGELLRAEGIFPGPKDLLFPGPEAPLRDGAVVQFRRAMPVVIAAGDRVIHLLSRERRPANILAEAGVPLFSGDQILVDGRPVKPDQLLPAAKTRRLQVRRAVRIELDGPKPQSIVSTAATLGQALAEAGIELHAGDALSPPADTPLTGDQAVISATWRPARTLRLVYSGGIDAGGVNAGGVNAGGINASSIYAGGSLTFQSAAQTVGEALAEAGFSLQGLDTSHPSPESPLPADGEIRLVRVREEVVVENEPLPFETELQPAPEVELDQRQVLQAGEYGLTARRVRIRYEDGVEVERKVEAEWVAKAPQNRIVGYGTKIVIRTLQTPDGPIEYWRAVPMYATSYSPCRIFKDRCDDYTALGATLQKGVLAMTNDWCRYTCGDRFYIPGYGIGTVLDTGGGIPGRYWIDLGYSEEDYVSWHQWVTVYFLTPVPANYQVVLP